MSAIFSNFVRRKGTAGNNMRPDSITFTSRFFVLVGIFLLCQSMFSFLGVTIASRLHGISYAEAIGLVGAPELTPAGVGVQRWVQSFYNLGSFFITALVFQGFYRKPLFGSPGLVQPANRLHLLYAALLVPALVFLMSALADWNLHLPGIDRLGDLSTLQEKRNKMLEVLMYTGSAAETFLLILLLAAIPALSEEVFFRGLLQRYFSDWFGRTWPGILLSAFLFTLLHFSVTQFLPIFLMGMLLGYLYHWTRSLLVPLLFHFINNSLTVVFHQLSKSYPDQALFRDDYTPGILLVLLSLLASAVLVWFVYRSRVQEEAEQVWP
ncbi:MAG: CPBP family intramembrane glutamic endopeptidase [Bacteroidia bacterium]